MARTLSFRLNSPTTGQDSQPQLVPPYIMYSEMAVRVLPDQVSVKQVCKIRPNVVRAATFGTTPRVVRATLELGHEVGLSPEIC